MNSTVCTVTSESALAALVLFDAQRAFAQLRLWSTTAFQAWREAIADHEYCINLLDDAVWALDEARDRRKPMRQKRAEAEESRIMNGGHLVDIVDADEETRYIWSGEDGSSYGDEEGNPDYSIDERFTGGDYAMDGAVGLYAGDPDADLEYAVVDTGTFGNANAVGFYGPDQFFTAARWSGARKDAIERAYRYMDRLLEPAENGRDSARAREFAEAEYAREEEVERDDGSHFEVPDWCYEDIIDGQQAVKDARRAKNAAHEDARTECTEKLRAQRMMAAFFAQFSEYQEVARLRRKRSKGESGSERAAKRPHGATLPPAGRKAMVQAWRKSAKAVLKDRAAMAAFPEPPTWNCFSMECRKNDRKLRACECNITAAFEGLGTRQLKKERHEWHPDRFGVCREDERVVWQVMATEMFTAISSMLRVF